MALRRRGPLRAFRIGSLRYSLFDGSGSALHANRWNNPGQKVIYAAETFAGALLEILVHTNLGRPPRNYGWIEISVPTAMEIEQVRDEEIPGWNAADLAASRSCAGEWYRRRRTAVLLVPSVVTCGIECNVLINQQHPDFARIHASEPRALAWDDRLFHG